MQAMKEIHILSLGAGVQSTMLYLLACQKHEIMPPLDAAVFADTGEEPKAVYEHLKWLKTLTGPPILERNAGDRLGNSIIHGRYANGKSTVCNTQTGRRRFATIPAFTKAKDGKIGKTRRECTKEYKTDVVERTIRRDILGLKPRQRLPKDVVIHQYMGLSFDEARRVLKVRAIFYGKTQWQVHFPLFESNTTRAGCRSWLERQGIPHRVPRSACTFCPFHCNEEWRAMRSVPEDWQRACQVDDALRSDDAVCNRSMTDKLYVHRSCVPLREAMIDETETKPEWEQNEMEFASECEGMCGV